MKSKNLIFTILFAGISTLAMFQSCNSGAVVNVKGTLINGSIADAGGIQLFLDHINYDNSNDVIAKVEIESNGNFSVPLEEVVENGIYRIRIGVKKAFFIFDGSEKKITIDGDLATFDTYDFQIDGSPSSKEFCDFMKKLSNGSANANDAAEFVKSKINSNPLMASFIMLNVFPNSMDQLDLAKQLSSTFVAADPNSKYAKDYKAVVDALVAKKAAMMANKLVQVGLPAPEIDLATPDGKKFPLSDLKGKVVLLDFWASWCGPCRKANPHVVETYNKYKDKGFTVYSVSLDGINPRLRNRFKTQEEVDQQMEKAKQKWLAAIQKDGLIWDAHVSDLQHWNSVAAKTYGVRSIPQTFLINRDGTIAAINPRNNLEEALLKIL